MRGMCFGKDSRPDPWYGLNSEPVVYVTESLDFPNTSIYSSKLRSNQEYLLLILKFGSKHMPAKLPMRQWWVGLCPLPERHHGFESPTA